MSYWIVETADDKNLKAHEIEKNKNKILWAIETYQSLSVTYKEFVHM